MTRPHTTTGGHADRDGLNAPGNPDAVEWIGGIFAVPAVPAGAVGAAGAGGDEEDEPGACEGLFWVDADGAIVNASVAQTGELLPIACASLQRAIEMPRDGWRRTPTRIRVASPELAAVLRAGCPELDVVCAPTPNLERALTPILQRIFDTLREGHLVAPTYLAPGVAPEAVAALFRAVASLERAWPPDIALDDEFILAVTVEQLGVQDAIVSVFGQEDEIYSVTVFPSIDDFDVYRDAMHAIELGWVPELPPHLTLSFGCSETLASELLAEIAEYGWEVAGPTAYPRLISLVPPLAARLPRAEEVALVEAIVLALAAALDDRDVRDALGAAWMGDERATHTLSVHGHQGEIAVTLATPDTREPIDSNQTEGLLAELVALVEGAADIDWDARKPLVETLMRRFAAAPEAQDLAEITACYYVMDLAASYLGACLATIGPIELRYVLFALVPRDELLDPSQAEQIIEELHAFYRFLQREYGLKQAGSCLRVLSRNAVGKLEAALDDPDKFGIAKSAIIVGQAAGFDMHTSEGIEGFVRTFNLSGPKSTCTHAPRDAAKKAAARRKQKRKRARKARKRNR